MRPTLLTRYVTSELSKVFLVTLSIFTFLMVFVGVAKEALQQGLGLLPVLRLIPYALPNALVFALPGAILFSTCNVYGRMAAANEVVAIKSVGISPAVVIRPALVLAFLLSCGSVWLTDIAFSWGHAGMRRVVLDSVVEIAYGVLRTKRTFDVGGFSISVAGVEGRRLLQPTITVDREDGEAVTMTAREAELSKDAAGRDLRVVLRDGAIDMGEDVTFRFFDTIEDAIPLRDSSEASGAEANPAHLRLCEMRAARRGQLDRIREARQSLAAEAAGEMLMGDFDALTDSEWRSRAKRLAREEQRLHRMEVEPFRRYASGFSCLCFVAIGLPLAIRLRNADFMTTFGICFLPILLVYYPLFAFGLDRAKSGELPPCSVWLGNVVCLGVGVLLLRTVVRR